MTNTLSQSATRVQQYLAALGYAFCVKELSTSTRTASDAAHSIGCELSQIVKSLLFRTAQTAQPILVLASGAHRVNESIISALMGEKVVKADADYTRTITGYAIGGIPPVAHQTVIDHIFIDEALLDHKVIWAAAGTPNAVFSLNSGDLVTLTNGKVISIK